MNGNKTLSDLQNTACAYGIASRAVQDERDSNFEKKTIAMEKWIQEEFKEVKGMIDTQTKRINKIYLALIPSILSLVGIILVYLKK